MTSHRADINKIRAALPASPTGDRIGMPDTVAKVTFLAQLAGDPAPAEYDPRQQQPYQGPAAFQAQQDAMKAAMLADLADDGHGDGNHTCTGCPA